MSLVDRLNRWIVGRVRQEVAIEATPEGFAWVADGKRQVVPWRKVRRVVALNYGAGLEAVPGLAIELDAGTLELKAGMRGWDELRDRLGSHLSLAMSPASWGAELASREDAVIPLYERGAPPTG